MIENFKNFLFVVSHPDDEVLGCGGIIKKLSKKNKNIKVIFLAEGSSCRYNQENYDLKKIKKEIEYRKSCAKKALKDLGVKKYSFYDLKCGNLHLYSILDLGKIIENEITKFKADVIFTHSNIDVHVDHRTVYQACLQASRPVPKMRKIKALISFETQSSTECNYSEPFIPNLFINIDKEINSKIKAIKRYKSEIIKFPHPRSKTGIESLAKFRGSQSSNKYAEAFIVNKYINE